MHNAERCRLRVPDLAWNPHLEREAAEWARYLSHRGVLEHADDRTRNGAGENLWMGTSGGWDEPVFRVCRRPRGGLLSTYEAVAVNGWKRGGRLDGVLH